ncbi:2-C-methyl-D-erythritol 4-phosphate cytidylyltransferase [Prosthecochloris sp. GSB1]|uniref:2-C-methyl-D-erythritol 4-phosphate cytidylyltransferase n=1 Tax=Prosthecochloris sp. GSB1 TaxID=281093 RepID=UPI000B8CA069|nr:2-C-methyl-D-erythritol 4-phosphate cytidylyltransferase [Prosthecochloris sp. GSB1]ASQ90220.1 2-C-methyl-D-erythritol 4-phosphate cytidylyltransferase [Prosthecochloris sp. GSB1]
MSSYAIIAASGVGKRMKLQDGLSKQMLEIGGRSVIYHTLSAFERASSVDAVYIATKPDSIETLLAMAERDGFSKVKAVIEGGKERQDSIYNCIERIEKDMHSGKAAMPDAILVHDGARPFIQPEEIDDIAALSIAYGACVPATKPKDTIKYIGENPEFFGETLDRGRLVQVQTPQGFTAPLLIQAHRHAKLEQSYATDDAAIVERFFPAQRIRIYEMGYHNIKITTPEDIHLAEAILTKLRNERFLEEEPKK